MMTAVAMANVPEYAPRSRLQFRAIAFGNLGVEGVNIAGTVLLSRCVRGQVSPIFTLDARRCQQSVLA